MEDPTREEIEEIINKSRNGKSPGKDGINIEMLKYGGPELKERLYQLITKIWKEEKMPQDWEHGQIITIHKKGDQKICNNYRGITLLNTAYKIMASLIQRRLVNATKGTVEQYQCGFTQGKSTVDAIHTVKQLMEKTYQHKIELELLFIDFQQAFDSIKRKELKRALKKLGVPSKLRRLIMMTMKRTTVSIKTQKGETEEFEIDKGVRQGDSLSATLFNLALQYVLRKIKKGTLRTRGGQIVAYADDIVLITKNRSIMLEMLKELIAEGKKMGLKINENKTKMMRPDKECTNGRIQLGEYIFEEVDKFKYLGVIMDKNGERDAEIKEKILTTNRVIQANKKLIKSKLLSKNCKIKIYRTIIRPTLMYAAETLSMTKKQEEELRIIERKVMRIILGPIKLSDTEYRRRTNQELSQEIGDDVVKKIKQQRAKWLGHIWRAGPGSVIYEVLDWKLGRTKRRGRPRSTWIQEVEQDLNGIGIINWKDRTKDRKIWNKICEAI